MGKAVSLLLCLAMLLNLAACGHSERDNNPDASLQEDFLFSSADSVEGEPQVLILKSLHGGWDAEDSVEGRLAEAFNRTHPGKVIRLEELSGGYEFNGSTLAYETTIATELMSGEADYILDVFNLDPVKYAKSGLFYDLYEWMDSDPAFHREDYYEDIFKAMEFDGHLYTTPTMFDMTAVYLNKSITDKLGLSFQPMDKISYKTILQIRADAVAQGLMPEDEPILFRDGCPAGYMFLDSELKSYVDWEAQKTHFSDTGFVDYLTSTKEIPSQHSMAYGMEDKRTGEIHYSTALQDGSEKSLFTRDTLNLSRTMNNGMTKCAEGLSGPLLMASASGEVLVSTSFSIMVPKSCKNPELAWEFLKFCMEPVENPVVWTRASKAEEIDESDAVDICFGAFPVNKQNMSTFAELYGAFDDEPAEKWMPKLEEAIASVKSFGFGTANLELLVYDTLERYYDYGTLSAEDCAKEMDKRAYIYLNE